MLLRARALCGGGVDARGGEYRLSAKTSVDQGPESEQREIPAPGSRAARFITGVTWDDLPAEVVRKAKLCLADTLASMVAGRVTSSSKIAAELAMDWWPATDA